jgi:aryl-alcohol dehydrogenase-like predicted oxidoreductase
MYRPMNPTPTGPMDPTPTAIGTWSGGRYMHFGEPLEEDRLCALLRPGGGIDTVITADAYGAGAADSLLGKALEGVARDAYCLVGAIGHDFYAGERDGAKGYPRFTDPRLRGEGEYGDYIRLATERSLQRIGVDRFDLLLLHNPDRVGYCSPAVWEGMAAVREAGLTRMLGVAPGPANGFTLDVIGCIERFGELIDWAMIIFGPMEPWPGELVLGAAQANDVSLIARVVDYGGLFHDDILPGHAFAERDHRRFRPDGWIEAGKEKLERMRPYARARGLTMLQLACAWDLAQAPVRCVAPTLIQEPAGPGGGVELRDAAANGLAAGRPSRPIEDKRAELAAVAGLPGIAGGNDGSSSGGSSRSPLSAEEVAQIRTIGENTGCMALKGANPAHEGPERPDRWGLDSALAGAAGRWGIDPGRDLAFSHPAGQA